MKAIITKRLKLHRFGTFKAEFRFKFPFSITEVQIITQAFVSEE